MHRVFNCGIGMAIVMSATHAESAIDHLKEQGLSAWQIGDVVERPTGAHQTIVV